MLMQGICLTSHVLWTGHNGCSKQVLDGVIEPVLQQQEKAGCCTFGLASYLTEVNCSHDPMFPF